MSNNNWRPYPLQAPKPYTAVYVKDVDDDVFRAWFAPAATKGSYEMQAEFRNDSDGRIVENVKEWTTIEEYAP